MRNTKFSTSMQMAKPHQLKEIQPIFDLLNAQPFTISIDFINTAFTCSDTLLVQRIIAYTLTKLPVSSCSMSYNNSIVSLSVPLPSHDISILLTLPGLKTIGAIRLGLYGPANSYEDGRYDKAYTLELLVA